MNIRQLFNLILRRKSFERPATITRQNIKGFLQGNFRSFTFKLGFLRPAQEVEEQAWWRINMVKERSPICIGRGQCKVCGCAVDEKVFEDRACEGGCYPKMMNWETWEFFKDKHNISIEL